MLDFEVDCPPGEEDVNGTCTNCLIGQYRIGNESAFCEPCPPQTTTFEDGSSSPAECVGKKLKKGAILFKLVVIR